MNMTDKVVVVDEVRDAYVAWTNTDTTEGRGWTIPKAVCETEATARRLSKGCGVMGSDGEITSVPIFKYGSYWYGPIRLQSSTKEDDRVQAKIDARKTVLDKAKSLGLTEDEINTLSNHPLTP